MKTKNIQDFAIGEIATAHMSGLQYKIIQHIDGKEDKKGKRKGHTDVLSMLTGAKVKITHCDSNNRLFI